MTAHAPSPTSASVAARVAALPHLSMDDLWALWDDHFDERPNHHHRVWLESRLAYRIQERAFGGLKPSLRKTLEEVGETGILPKQLRGDSQRVVPGTPRLRRSQEGEAYARAFAVSRKCQKCYLCARNDL